MCSSDVGWKLRADEVYEGTAFNELTYTIPLVQPAQLTLQKSMDVINGPVNGTSNPKAISGARIEYTLTVSNAGEGTTDTDSIAIVDKLATGTDFYVGTDANVSPISLVDGNPASNLTLTFENLTSTTDDVEFSNDGGLTFGYQPTPDANGFDPLITDFRITPTGTTLQRPRSVKINHFSTRHGSIKCYCSTCRTSNSNNCVVNIKGLHHSIHADWKMLLLRDHKWEIENCLTHICHISFIHVGPI